MIRILYSFGMSSDSRLQAEFLASIRADTHCFIPFEHRPRLGGRIYHDAYRLDIDWRRREPRLMALYRDLERALVDSGADVLAVDTDNVYHPEFLRTLPIYKVLVSTDDPTSSYARTVPYLHAFDHVTTVTPLYNERTRIREFLLECGARRASLKPIGVTPFTYDPSMTEEQLFAGKRDVEVVFVGAYYWQKADAFRALFRALGSRLVVHGFWDWKAHVKYVRDTHSFRLVRKISYSEMVRLYQRSKIGINLHTDEFSLGNMRLFQLPANGVMQVCDCAANMHEFFEPGREVLTFQTIDECIALVLEHLSRDQAREEIARAGYRRTMREYTFERVWERFVSTLEEAIRTKAKPGGG